VHRSHNFTGCGTNHREAEDAVVAVGNKGFHKALPMIGSLRPEYRIHRQPCNAGDDALTFRFAFAQPDAGKRGISEHAIGNQPITGAAVSSRQIVTYDSKIVFRNVRELWAAGAFPHRPYFWRSGLEPIVNADVTTTVQLNAGLFKSNSGGIRSAPSRDQHVAAVYELVTEGARTVRLTLSPDRPRTWSSSAPTRT
jgi:hypothetical protein